MRQHGKGRLQLEQLQGALDILLAPLRDDALRADIHVKERPAEVAAGQRDADFGVCKVCISGWEEAPRQVAILCKVDPSVTALYHVWYD